MTNSIHTVKRDSLCAMRQREKCGKRTFFKATEICRGWLELTWKSPPVGVFGELLLSLSQPKSKIKLRWTSLASFLLPVVPVDNSKGCDLGQGWRWSYEVLIQDVKVEKEKAKAVDLGPIILTKLMAEADRGEWGRQAGRQQRVTRAESRAGSQEKVRLFRGGTLEEPGVLLWWAALSWRRIWKNTQNKTLNRIPGKAFRDHPHHLSHLTREKMQAERSLRMSVAELGQNQCCSRGAFTRVTQGFLPEGSNALGPSFLCLRNHTNLFFISRIYLALS